MDISKITQAAETTQYDELMQCNGSIADAFAEVINGDVLKRDEFSNMLKKIEKTKGRNVYLKVKFAEMIIGATTDEVFRQAVEKIETHGAD